MRGRGSEADGRGFRERVDMIGRSGSCEKDLRLLGIEFRRQGEDLQKKLSKNLSLKVRGGKERQMIRGASFNSRFDIDEIMLCWLVQIYAGDCE